MRLPLTCLLAGLAVALPACGSNEPDGAKLPPDVSQSILVELEGIDNRVSSGFAGACDDIFEGVAGGNFDTVDSALADIPDDVDGQIRSALEESIDRLKQLTDQECERIRAQEQDSTTETDTVETAPPETDTETTETTPPQTETTETTPPVEQPDLPPGNGPDGNGPPGQQDGGGLELPGEDDE